MSAPVSRARVFAQRFAALVIGIATLMIAAGAALWIFSALLGMGLSLGAIASAAAALGIFGLFAGAVAIAVGAATGSPAAARGLAALAVVASYLINALAQMTSVLRPARPVSPYYLVLGNEPLAHGLRLIGALGARDRGRARGGRRHPVHPPRPELRAMGPGRWASCSVVIAAALCMAAVSCGGNPAPAANPLRVTPCTVQGRSARCGTLAVAENRLTGHGRRIRIEFVVFPATGRPRPGRLLRRGPWRLGDR